MDPSLERAQAGEGHEQRQRPDQEEERQDHAVDPHEGPGAQQQSEGHERSSQDGGEPADPERHGESPFLRDRGPLSALMEVGIEGAEEDVGDVERTERALLEEGLELVAVARPPEGGIELDQERCHGWLSPSCRSPCWANADRPRSCSARFAAPIAVRR